MRQNVVASIHDSSSSAITQLRSVCVDKLEAVGARRMAPRGSISDRLQPAYRRPTEGPVYPHRQVFGDQSLREPCDLRRTLALASSGPTLRRYYCKGRFASLNTMFPACRHSASARPRPGQSRSRLQRYAQAEIPLNGSGRNLLCIVSG
jgi:hypothetical protein